MCQSDVRFAMIRLHDFIYSFTQRVGYLATVCFVIQLFHFGILAGGVCPSRGSMCLDGPLRTPLLPWIYINLAFLEKLKIAPGKPSKNQGEFKSKYSTHFEENYVICKGRHP